MGAQHVGWCRGHAAYRLPPLAGLYAILRRRELVGSLDRSTAYFLTHEDDFPGRVVRLPLSR